MSSKEILAIFADMNDDYNEAETNEQIQYPEPGDHEATLSALNMTTIDMKLGQKGKNDNPVKGVKLAFEYTLTNDPDDPDNPLTWPAVFRIAPPSAKGIMTEGQRKNYDITMSQIKTCLERILGEDNLRGMAQDVQAIQEEIAANAILLNVHFRVKESKKNGNTYVNRDTFINERVA